MLDHCIGSTGAAFTNSFSLTQQDHWISAISAQLNESKEYLKSVPPLGLPAFLILYFSRLWVLEAMYIICTLNDHCTLYGGFINPNEYQI